MESTQNRDAELGIVTTGPAVYYNFLLSLISISAPVVGIVGGLLYADSLSLNAVGIAVFAVFFIANVLGAGLGLHRYFTHRAFKIGSAGKVILAFCASIAMQGPIDRWVADHRRHHRFTDKAHDPHSPYWKNERRINSRIIGLFHAHIGWMFTGDVTSTARYGRDTIADPVVRFFSRTYLLWCVVSLGLPALIGFVYGGTQAALVCFFWAGCVRVCLVQNLTWSVNSFGHMYGQRDAKSMDESRDNLFLTLLLLGEGLHNYHHRFPSAAVNQPVALDIDGMAILLLEKAGLVSDVKRFSTQAAEN
jgi:stearoyl-CoA desaturase (delta-9 desaturase)